MHRRHFRRSHELKIDTLRTRLRPWKGRLLTVRGGGYKLDGREIDYLPASEHAQARVEPVYEVAEGWNAVSARARSWSS